MAWLAKNKFRDQENVFSEKPKRVTDYWEVNYYNYASSVELPNGTIERILGYSLSWEDEPVEI